MIVRQNNTGKETRTIILYRHEAKGWNQPWI
jgi:hypothetical protein